jgi:6-phosphogluconolactonase (cycloisomerase 2 family)
VKQIVASILLMLVLAGALQAQPNFLYVNNNQPGLNTVTGFSVAANGTLSPLPGSPFPTGGTGDDAGYYAGNRIIACVVGAVLYVANQGSGSVSAMRINPITGALVPVPGSPFPTGGASSGYGVSLAATPDDRFLFVGNGGSSDVTAFQVAANGSLSQVAGSPFALPTHPDGSRVTPDGRFLVMALPDLQAVGVLSIAASGALNTIPGSPFPAGGGAPTGVDMDCGNQFVFVGNASGNTAVDVFARLPGGALSPIPGSPFVFGSGSNSNVAILSPDDRFLFVSNQGSNTVTSLSVASNGSLSVVPGSPFPNPGGGEPQLMATDQAGTLLYVANGNGTVSVFRIAANGALAVVPGSAFPSGPGMRTGVAPFPPKSCEHFCTPANQPAAFVAPTPACGSVLTALVGAPFSFDVSASDPDSGDVVGLDATGVPPGATFTPALPVSGNPVTSHFAWTPAAVAVGDHAITFGAGDRCGHLDSCVITVRVTANRNPDCSGAVASEQVLWPPNHQYHSISVLGVTDPDGDPVTVTVTRITQDEPVNTRGDGATCPDGQIVNGQASVRAERTGTPGIPGNGRVYAISFTASDGKGGSCNGTVYACVPHDQGTHASCLDDGQRYNSLGPCSDGSQLRQEVAELGLTVGEVSATQATLELALPQAADVDVSVFDVAGRRLATIERGQLPAGVYERAWEMGGSPRGLYFVRLRAGAETLTRTVVKAH